MRRIVLSLSITFLLGACQQHPLKMARKQIHLARREKMQLKCLTNRRGTISRVHVRIASQICSSSEAMNTTRLTS